LERSDFKISCRLTTHISELIQDNHGSGLIS
jgi:hypothetical protein